MSKPNSLNWLVLDKTRFVKQYTELLQPILEVEKILINMSISCGAMDLKTSVEDKSRNIFLKVELFGYKNSNEKTGVSAADDKLFVYESILNCRLEKKNNIRTKKNIDDIIQETIWYYGSILYQIIRARMLQSMRETAIGFAPPVDINASGIDIVYTCPKNI